MASEKIKNGKRCQDKAYIVLVGLTGGGKSSTLNALFDRNRADSKEITTSDTQTIKEYRIQVATEKNKEAKNLFVIDTPGFADTRSTEKYGKDAQIMATLEKYLDTHDDLKNCYPNAVLLVINFNDERIEADRSHFVQFLKALEHLMRNDTLVDKGQTTCNLIIVLTKFMDVSNELQECPAPRIRLIQGLIKSFTSIPSNVQVVIAENKASMYNVKQTKGYYELPNGELYPSNLFQAIMSIQDLPGKDFVGKQTLIDAFSDPFKLKISDVKENALLPCDHDDTVFYLHILKNDRTKTNETSMSRQLDIMWNNYLQGKRKYAIVLVITKETFSKEKIECERDLPSTVNKTLELVRQLPVDLTIEKILYDIGVYPPSILEYVKSVGYFYNISTDSVTMMSPFALDKHQHITHTGFVAPDFMRADLVSNVNSRTAVIVASYQNKEAYLAKRFHSFFPDMEYKDEKVLKFIMNPIPGHNVISSACTEISGVRELREYSASLTKDFSFHPSFLEMLNTLPSYRNSNWQIWTTFFAAYGTHIIRFAFLGGFIKVSAKKNQNEEVSTDASAVLKIVEDVLCKIGEVDNCALHLTIPDWDFSLEFIGGDPNLSKPRIDGIFSDSGVQFFSNWKDSLKLNPVLLLNDIKLEHISAYIKQENPALSKTVSTAAHDILGCGVYVDKDKESERSKCTIV